MSDFNFPYGTAPAAPPLEDRITEEKRLQWQVHVANTLGTARAQAFAAGAAQRAEEDTFDAGAPPDQQAAFKAEMYSGALSPARTSRRRQTLPPEDQAAYDDHVAAINVGRAAYDAGAAQARVLAEQRLHWSGQIAAFGRGSAGALDVGGLLTKMLPDFRDDLRKLHEQGGAYGQGQSDFGPRAKLGMEDRLLPPERQADLYFKGATAAYGEALGASPWGARLGSVLESAGGLSAFVAGPGGALASGGKALVKGAAIKVGTSKAAAGLLGVAGASAGYGAYSAALPISADEQDAIDAIMEKQGEAAATEAMVKLRALKAGVAALMWPVIEMTGGALGRAVKGQGVGKAAVRGYGQGLALSAIGAAEDLPAVREISEAIIGRDPGVKHSIGRLIMAYQDPEARPEDIANAWIDVGAEVGVGSAVFSGLHAATAFHASRSGTAPREPRGNRGTSADLAKRDGLIEEILAKRARSEMREQAPELAGLPALRPVVAEAADVRLPALVGGGPVLSKEESLARGTVGPLKLGGPKEKGEPDATAEASQPPKLIDGPTAADRREMLAQDEAKRPTGDVAKDAASRWRNDETRWITEQEPAPALAEYQREVDAYDGGAAPKRPTDLPDLPVREDGKTGRPTEALPGVPMEDPPADQATVKQPALEPSGSQPKAAKRSSKPDEWVGRPEETDAAFDLTIGDRSFPVEVRPSDVMKGKVEVSIPHPTGEGPPYVVIAGSVRDGVTRIAEHWEGTVVPRGRLGEDVVKATREKAAAERTEAAAHEKKLAGRAALIKARAEQIKEGWSVKEKENREAASRQRDLFKDRSGEQGGALVEMLADMALAPVTIPLRGIQREARILARALDIAIGAGADVTSKTRHRVSADLWKAKRGMVRRGWNANIADLSRSMGPSIAHEVSEFEARKRAIAAKVLREFRPYRKEIPGFTEKSQAIFDAVEGTITMEAATAIAGPNAPAIAKKLQRTFEKYRRWWVRVSPQAREMKQSITDLGHGIAKAQESITRPGLTDRELGKLRERIGRWESDIAAKRKELRHYQDTWGITGGKYLPHFFEVLMGDADFAKAHGRLVETLKPRISIGFGSLKHRTGEEGYIKDIWFALEHYSHGFLNKILGERMNRRNERLVYGRKKSVGSLERLAAIQKEGREIYHGPNEVKVEKVDAEAKTVTIRPASAKNDEFDEVLPATRAKRELTAWRGGLRDIASDRFMEGQFETRMKRILHREDKYLTSSIDNIASKIGRGLLNHMYSMALADPKVAGTNYIAGALAAYSNLGAHYFVKGQAMATAAAWGVVKSWMTGKKPTGKALWALEHLRRSGTLSDSEYSEYIGKSQIRIPSKKGLLQLGGRVDQTTGAAYVWIREHAPILFQLVEKVLRSGADIGAYLRDTQAFGKKHPEAMQSAYESVARTQFMYMASMSPQFLNWPGMRAAFALGQVPYRQLSAIAATVHEAMALDKGKGWGKTEGLRRYLGGESKHWVRPLRFVAASAFADALLALTGIGAYISIAHLFGTRLIDIAAIFGGDEILAAVEKETGIAKERLIVPGPLPGIGEGGVGISVAKDALKAVTSEENDRWEIFAQRIGPLIASRVTFKAWEQFTAEPIPERPGFVRTTYPMSGGKTKDMAITRETLLWQGLAPATPIQKIRDANIRLQHSKRVKRTAEIAQEHNDLALREDELLRAGKREEAKTVRARIDQIAEESGHETTQAELGKRVRRRKFGTLERGILVGSKQDQAFTAVHEYMERDNTTVADAEALWTEITNSGVKGIEQETQDAYFKALKALRAKTKKAVK